MHELEREASSQGCGWSAGGSILVGYTALGPAHTTGAGRAAMRRDWSCVLPAPSPSMRKPAPMHRSYLRRGRRWCVAALIGLLITTGAVGSALAALPTVPDGFKIRLVAAVPAVQYPVPGRDGPRRVVVRG